jgi:hypothetical protein
MFVPLRGSQVAQTSPGAPDVGSASSVQLPPEGATEQELREIIAHLLVNQSQLGTQLGATMAALGTLTTAVARQNATISTLMEQVSRLSADRPGLRAVRATH